MTIINTTSSILNSARKDVENTIHAIEHMIEGDVQGAATHVETVVKANVSRVVHSVKVEAISSGVDITVRVDHALGEVKRIVINGQLTVEGLIAHLRSLTGTPEPAGAVAPVAVTVPETTEPAHD